MSLSQQEFDYKWHSAFNCWIVNSNTFAVYFQKQWVEGLFIEGKVLSSGAGCTSTNKCNADEVLHGTQATQSW
jgi:hypothetical protein